MDRLNQWASLIANVGMIAGIVFLAYEIRINTNAVSTASATSIISNWIEEAGATARDPEIAEILYNINTQGWGAVPPVHAFRAAYVASAQFKASEFAHFQFREGNLDVGLWRGNDSGTYMFLWGQDYAREAWLSGVRSNFGREFQSYIDQMISDICSRRECRDLPEAYQQPAEMIKGVDAWSARF